MAVPLTAGKLCTSLDEMEIGDYIACYYGKDEKTPTDFGVIGQFFGLGEDRYLEEIQGRYLNQHRFPVVSTILGKFYFIKIEKGLLIADRNVQSMITWSALNTKNFVNGSNKGKILIRIPSFNEMEEYIINSDLEGSIIKADPDVWNFCTGDYIYSGDIWSGSVYKGSVPGSLCQDANGSNCLIFGLHGSSKNIRVAFYDSYGGYIDIAYKNGGVSCYKQPCKMAADQQPSNDLIYYLCAFRPVLEYKDNPKSENVFY